MGSRRALLVIVAVVLAIAAGGLALIVLTRAQDEAKGGLKEVVVAKVAVPQGVTIDENNLNTYFAVGKVATVPGDAILRGQSKQLNGMVTKVAIPKDQPLSMAFFGSKQEVALAGGNNEVAQILQNGTVAVTFSVDTSQGVGAFVQPGDRVNVVQYGEEGQPANYLLVDVLVLKNAPAAQASASGSASGSGTATTAAGSADGTGKVASGSTGTITVQVSATDALKIVDATTKRIYLTLNPAPVTTAPTTTTGN